MKKIILFIDTSEIYTAKVALEIDRKRHEKISESRVMKSQMVLPLIELISSEQHLKLGDITEIRLATGPGSFTGLRVGATAANALGYLLDIPVNGKKTLVIPSYS
jgi:tRNA threonylcarbamoyladenosine biosynthesis protein TsaB